MKNQNTKPNQSSNQPSKFVRTMAIILAGLMVLSVATIIISVIVQTGHVH